MYSAIMYTALVLDKESREALLRYVLPIEGWEMLAHHMTIEFPADTHPLLGKEVCVEATHWACDEKVIAVRISDAGLSRNKTPHVTIAVNRENGGKPVMSNNLNNWMMLRAPLTLFGTVRVLP